jgi:hypothetical protein
MMRLKRPLIIFEENPREKKKYKGSHIVPLDYKKRKNYTFQNKQGNGKKHKKDSLHKDLCDVPVSMLKSTYTREEVMACMKRQHKNLQEKYEQLLQQKLEGMFLACVCCYSFGVYDILLLCLQNNSTPFGDTTPAI